jgi:hypothetical protein
MADGIQTRPCYIKSLVISIETSLSILRVLISHFHRNNMYRTQRVQQSMAICSTISAKGNHEGTLKKCERERQANELASWSVAFPQSPNYWCYDLQVPMTEKPILSLCGLNKT